MFLPYQVIDLHTHLRDNIPKHTQIAKDSGIDIVIYMANSKPPLDNLKRIKSSLTQKRFCAAFPVSAITKNLAGQKLVNLDQIKPFVVGFSDDGNFLNNLNLLKTVLQKDVLILAHCSPSYVLGLKNPDLETKYIQTYLTLYKKIKKGKIHFQHLSKKGSVNLIRQAKKSGLKITCETCPHYFTYSREDLKTKTNPPLGTNQDIAALKQGLADGTIDVIASDYAPFPRQTGIAGFRSLIPLSYGLVLQKILTPQKLKEKLFLNPKKIIQSGGFKFKLNSSLCLKK